MARMTEFGLQGDRSPELYLHFPTWTPTWTIFCSFPRDICVELCRKWSGRDSKSVADMRCQMLHVVTYIAWCSTILPQNFVSRSLFYCLEIIYSTSYCFSLVKTASLAYIKITYILAFVFKPTFGQFFHLLTTISAFNYISAKHKINYK